MENLSVYIVPVLQIIWIDLLLSGDNAVVIALACRSLPEKQRRIGMLLGAGTAVALRILFALVITFILQVPFLKLVGALLLLWIGVKLVLGEEDGGHAVESSENLWRAVRTIAIADAVMSLDNVIAIAAAAGGNVWLFVFGLLLSIPLIIFGSTLLTSLIDRFPALIWFGAGLLGWIAGEMLVTDTAIIAQFQALDPSLLHAVQKSDGHGGFVSALEPVGWIHYVAAALGALFVVSVAYVMNKRASAGAA